jgi:hypothetical protein
MANDFFIQKELTLFPILPVFLPAKDLSQRQQKGQNQIVGNPFIDRHERV